MSLTFQSICSSSSGNCLALWSDTTRLLIDCGLSSMKRTRAALTACFTDPTRIDAVLLTHVHSDHIAHYPLRVLDEYGLTLHLHEDCLDPLREKHYKGHRLNNLKMAPHKNTAFTVGDFRIQPFEVAHNPAYRTVGYHIRHRDKALVIVTDFLDWHRVFEYFVDADFIFVESNHDLQLLRQYYNPNSRFHLPNPATAQLLVNARQHSRTAPQAVILGHLSPQRNNPTLALKETQTAFRAAGIKIDFPLHAAPLTTPGPLIPIR